MGDAAKVIDWNGIDVPAGVGELLAELPPGRYRIAVVPDDGLVSPEAEARILAARQSIAEGRGIPLAEVDTQLRGIIEAARAR
jgi:hypothetical protein